jgi:hypothetical protein
MRGTLWVGGRLAWTEVPEVKFQGPAPRTLTLSLAGDHLDIVERLQRELEQRGQAITLGDVVRDLVRAQGAEWLKKLEEEW